MSSSTRYSGKIINLAEFEKALKAANKETSLPTRIKEGFKRIKVSIHDDSLPMPALYTVNTADETALATQAGTPFTLPREKIFFEAASLTTKLALHNSLTSAFKRTIEQCTDQSALLAQGALTEIGAENNLSTSYNVRVKNPRQVILQAQAIPEGSSDPATKQFGLRHGLRGDRVKYEH